MTPEVTIDVGLQQFISQILLVVISLGLPVLIAGLIYLGRLLGAWIKTKVRLSKSQTDDLILIGLEQAARLFVKSAEQSGLAGAIRNEAATKKQYALDRITEYAHSRGWHDLGIGLLDAAIEAAVKDGVHKGFESPLGSLSIPLETPSGGLTEETGLAILKLFAPTQAKTELSPVKPGQVTGRITAEASREMSSVFGSTSTPSSAE